ncbi:MAG: hypothetical protein ACM3TR_02845 [Caulobacteraceae bacterium]
MKLLLMCEECGKMYRILGLKTSITFHVVIHGFRSIHWTMLDE